MNSSRRAKHVDQLSAVLRQTGRLIAMVVLLVGISLAQQTPQEPTQPTLHVQTDLVVIPFKVQRGSRPVSDLKPSDVILLEDGLPRAFTGFEAPAEHPSLELVVMFDVTDMQRETDERVLLKTGAPAGFWSAKTLHDMVAYWNETIARALLEEPGATVRISVYQFDKSRLRRLSRPTADPTEFLAALNRLGDPIPSGQGFDLQVPAGVVVRAEVKEAELKDGKPWPRSLLGAITVLGDSAVGPAARARARVLFSSGAEGTSITPQDLADQGIAANVPIYPVVLPARPLTRYEGYSYDSAEGISPSSGQLFPGLCANPLRPNGGFRGFSDCPLNKPFESVGISTGGRGFEAPRRPHDVQPDGGLARFSMTSPQMNDILETVKRHALARFTSSYTLWFAPSPSASPRKHKLEVKLPPKSSGKLSDGKRIAIY